MFGRKNRIYILRKFKISACFYQYIYVCSFILVRKIHYSLLLKVTKQNIKKWNAIIIPVTWSTIHNLVMCAYRYIVRYILLISINLTSN